MEQNRLKRKFKKMAKDFDQLHKHLCLRTKTKEDTCEGCRYWWYENEREAKAKIGKCGLATVVWDLDWWYENEREAKAKIGKCGLATVVWDLVGKSGMEGL